MQLCVLSLLCTVATFITAGASASDRSNFLKSGLVGEADVKAMLSRELSSSAGQAVREHVEYIKRDLSTMYTSLPKNEQGSLAHQVVRYALHRFFVRRHGWFIRGLEPTNDTWHGAADESQPSGKEHNNEEVVKEWVPSYLQDILEQKLGREGTDLDQLCALAAALEDLIQQETKGRLETVFSMYEYPVDRLLRKREADPLILTYYVAVLNSGDFAAQSRLEAVANTQDFIRDYAGWPVALNWLEEMKTKHLVAKSNERYDFEGIGHLANKVQEEYYTLNEQDCTDLKVTLRQMQGAKPGRVRLSTFYNKGMYSHWDFAEKKEYLRSLGVLDESDAAHPFVIIANYAMSRPNCLDSSSMFTICCKNECEELLGQLEGEIGAESAEPARVATLVASMGSTSVDRDRKLPQELLERLDAIAARHGGRVPLHGRLFAQWMHHAYPLECPYPHEMGKINPLTRGEWMKETGQETEKATTEEMLAHIAKDTCAIDAQGHVHCDEEESTELPWTDTEELLTWRAAAPAVPPPAAARTAPGRRGSTALACILAAAGLCVALRCRHHKAARPMVGLALAALACYVLGLLDDVLLFCVFACGLVVAVANRMTARPLKDAAESKECV